MSLAWVLNLDADLELAALAAGRRYAPTDAVVRAMFQPRSLLAQTLLDPDDVVIDEMSPRGAAAGRAGRAFCPTPRALALLDRAGAVSGATPPPDVLVRVNDRAFAAGLGQTLPGAAFVRDLATARTVLATIPATPHAPSTWRAKRRFAMAGRGQRKMRPPLEEGDVAFLASALARDGGIQLEPDLAIARELGIHGLLREGGVLELGSVVQQTTDPHGQWLATARIVDEPHAAALVEEAERVAASLHAAGYFGPFGIDAFVYDGDRLQPRSEINARYSMGFAAGFLGR